MTKILVYHHWNNSRNLEAKNWQKYAYVIMRKIKKYCMFWLEKKVKICPFQKKNFRKTIFCVPAKKTEVKIENRTWSEEKRKRIFKKIINVFHCMEDTFFLFVSFSPKLGAIYKMFLPKQNYVEKTLKSCRKYVIHLKNTIFVLLETQWYLQWFLFQNWIYVVVCIHKWGIFQYSKYLWYLRVVKV